MHARERWCSGRRLTYPRRRSMRLELTAPAGLCWRPEPGRRTVAVQQSMAVAVSPHKVQRLMRHSSVAVLTRFYEHLTVQDLRGAGAPHTPLLASAVAQFAPPAPQAENQSQAGPPARP